MKISSFEELRAIVEASKIAQVFICSGLEQTHFRILASVDIVFSSWFSNIFTYLYVKKSRSVNMFDIVNKVVFFL